MTSLVERFDSLSINDEKGRMDFFGYVFRTKKAKNYFLCNNDFIVIPSFDEKKMVLRKLESFVFCAFNVKTFVHTKSASCIHVKLSTVNRKQCLKCQ